jgi:hypothetical protein
MSTLTLEQPNVAELRQLARQARDYQTERGWSDAQMLREIPQLGSTKTYKRILDPEDALDELNIDNQLRAYRHAIELIELRRKSDKFAEPEYESFTNISTSLAAISRALTEDSIARFVAIEGENGTGKDAVKNALLKRWGNITLATEANEFWRDSLAAPLNAILTEYNRARKADLKARNYPMLTFELLVETIADQRLVLLVNEAHHLGPRGLNLLKSLINRCPRLVIVAEFIPSLLRRLMTQNYEEAIQLFGNRLCERVKLPSPPANEITELMEKRGIVFDDPKTMKAVLDELAGEARNFGNWRYVIQFTREARALADGKPLTLAHFAAARTKARERRVTNQGRN